MFLRAYLEEIFGCILKDVFFDLPAAIHKKDFFKIIEGDKKEENKYKLDATSITQSALRNQRSISGRTIRYTFNSRSSCCIL